MGVWLKWGTFKVGEFVSLDSYSQFERSLKAKARFVHEKSVREFLDTVLLTAPKRLKKLKKGSVLFRAQKGAAKREIFITVSDDGETIEAAEETAHPEGRMWPTPEFAGDGRLSPRGIVCLYLASTPGAALAEMQPWLGAPITLAKFRVLRDCIVVDCSGNTLSSVWREPITTDGEEDLKEPDAVTKEDGVWGDIGHAFSKPVARDEPHLDYVPTQVLAEAFRDKGYVGVVYKSLMDEAGTNVALFDLTTAELISCCLYKTRSATFNFARHDDDESWPESIQSDFAPNNFLDSL